MTDLEDTLERAQREHQVALETGRARDARMLARAIAGLRQLLRDQPDDV